MKMLTLLLSLLIGLNVTDAASLERSSVTSNSSTYESLQQTIEDLEALRDTIANKIAELEVCGDNSQLYDNSTGLCKPVITENDPEVLDHSRSGATGDITNNCPSENEVQYYNGATWTCEQKGP